MTAPFRESRIRIRFKKTVRAECDKIYPPISFRTEVYEKTGNYCVRVDIDYSGETPHFSGPAWVRRGSETIRASEEIFQKLIELRLSTVRELQKWVGREVTIEDGEPALYEIGGRTLQHAPRKADSQILAVNSFYVTYTHQGKPRSKSLQQVLLSFDNEKDRLKLVMPHIYY
jgi:hypothetical protein